MLLTAHPNLKLEIRSLPEKEKDKLLLRLIAKDKVLTEHLHFKLLENEEDLAGRSANLLATIDEGIAALLSSKKLNSKDVLTQIRSLTGKINHHFKVTKDINSDIELRIYLLRHVPVAFNEEVFSSLHKYNEKLNIYFVKSVVAVLKKYDKTHEDIQFDLKESINEVLIKTHNNKTRTIAKELGLPKER